MTILEFNSVFNQYHMNIFYFCNRILYCREDAEDIASLTFLMLWENKDSIRLNTVKSYLFTIAVNKCRDFIRKRAVYDKWLSSTHIQHAEPSCNDGDAIHYVHRLTELLPAQQKQMFKLRYFEDVPPKEIAVLLGLSHQTIRNTLYTAVARIRKELKSRGVDHG